MTLVGLLAVAILASPSSTPAADWGLVSATADRVVGIDRDSIISAGPTKTFWVVLVDRQVDDDGGDYSVVRFATNCETQMARTLSLFRYGEQSAAPTDRMTDPQPWQDIIPGTGGERLSDAVCNDAWTSDVSHEEIATFVGIARITMRN